MTIHTQNDIRIEHTKGLGCHHYAAFLGTLYIGTHCSENEARAEAETILAASRDGMRLIAAGGNSRLQSPLGGDRIYGIRDGTSTLLLSAV